MIITNIQALALGVANGLVSGAASLVTGAGKFEGSLLRESSNKIRQSILSKTIKTPAKNVSRGSNNSFRNFRSTFNSRYKRAY
jgi:hypothetical protein